MYRHGCQHRLHHRLLAPVMHEMSLAENVLHMIEAAAQTQHFSRVHTVWLEIGQLACVESQSLRFYFDIVTQDSIAHHARLEIIDTPGQGLCNVCHRLSRIASRHDACENCGNYGLQITDGDSMRITELEVE